MFIDEAYYLYRQENERDYGQEAIEILLQVMENNRDDLVVILAGYADKMDCFFRSNPGFRSRVAHHIDFPDYTDDDLLAIGEKLLASLNYRLSASARGETRRVYAAQARAAALRQRAFDPQRARQGALAPGQPAVRRARSGADARSDHDHRGVRPPPKPGRSARRLRRMTRRTRRRRQAGDHSNRRVVANALVLSDRLPLGRPNPASGAAMSPRGGKMTALRRSNGRGRLRACAP